MVVTFRIVTDGRRNKVAGYQHSALVNKLIKCMLAIGTRLTPDHGAGGVLNPLPVPVCTLAVAFHITLLKISSKAMHVLIIR